METVQYDDAYFEQMRLRHVEHYKAILADNPLDADAHYKIGITYSTLGQYATAIKHFQTAVRLAPEHFHGYNRDGFVTNIHAAWGSLLSGTGNLREALLHYREASRLSPENGPLSACVASILRDLGQTDAAIEQYKVASSKEVQRDPGVILDALGEMYIEKKMLREAADSFERDTKASPVVSKPGCIWA